MLSICSCTINSCFDVKSFIEHLSVSSTPGSFELVLVHDKRVDDGTTEVLADLSKKHEFLRVIEQENTEVIRYLWNCMNYYHNTRVFSSEVIRGLEHNLKLYESGNLVDPTKEFLWLSSGFMYNQAVAHSRGSVLLITPSDFFYAFDVADLEQYVQVAAQRGKFYSSPHSLFARVSNHPHADDKIAKANSIGDLVGHQLRRDMIYQPSALSDLVVADPRSNIGISITDMPALADFVARESLCENGPLFLRDFHGFHVMTKASFDEIGGFTEEWFGRAWADDRMTALGRKHFTHELPSRFSVLWCKQSEYYEADYPGPGWRKLVEQRDPKFDTRPRPGEGARYLQEGVLPIDIHKTFEHSFGYYGSPVRLT